MMHSRADLIFNIAGMWFVFLLLALFVVIVISLIKVWRTKIETPKEEMYKKLAIDAAEVQKETARQQEKLLEELADIKERLATIERILKEVE